MNGNNVTWYTCGPTVYSHSHMGHARNYICNDMIRKILERHFGYNVKVYFYFSLVWNERH